jgi:hypothetical protein
VAVSQLCFLTSFAAVLLAKTAWAFIDQLQYLYEDGSSSSSIRGAWRLLAAAGADFYMIRWNGVFS